ncbi:MAG: hypothetical protein ACLR4B_01270 [Bacteroides fragilis]
MEIQGGFPFVGCTLPYYIKEEYSYGYLLHYEDKSLNTSEQAVRSGDEWRYSNRLKRLVQVWLPSLAEHQLHSACLLGRLRKRC